MQVVDGIDSPAEEDREIARENSEQRGGKQMTGRMYKAAVATWNPYIGCKFACTYCVKSFQAQAKRQRKRCMKCYRYEPHCHPERLKARLPRTGFGEFIFCCSMGDVAFCRTGFLSEIRKRIFAEPGKTFLLQSKNPSTFLRLAWPRNVILGTTAETNQATALVVTKAPDPIERLDTLAGIDHPYKMVTCEPIMDFTVDRFAKAIIAVNPCLVWIGYDSRKTGLPEPSMEKVKALTVKLLAAGINVRWKGRRLCTGKTSGIHG